METIAREQGWESHSDFLTRLIKEIEEEEDAEDAEDTDIQKTDNIIYH